MTNFYLSTVAGKVPSEANVTEGTSSPTAEVFVAIGTGNVPVTSLSRKFVIASLLAFINYLKTDDPDNQPGGAGTITLLP